MWAVVSSTASLLTGAVANPSAEGTCTGGAQIMWPTTWPSTTATRPHEPHSRSTIETQAAFSSASWPAHRVAPYGVELPEHARRAPPQLAEVVERQPLRAPPHPSS